MKRSMWGLCVVILGSALLASGGCGSSSGAGASSTTDESSDLSQLARERSRRAHTAQQDATVSVEVDAASVGGAATPSAPDASTPAVAPPPSGMPAATPTDVQAVISAAQSPDGTAIPQGPGPNGQCPQVLVLLGFWSCPQIGQTCTYAAAGVSHNCACDKLNGEGGLPAWVCDQ
jgi:hypothetical protein